MMMMMMARRMVIDKGGATDWIGRVGSGAGLYDSAVEEGDDASDWS